MSLLPGFDQLGDQLNDLVETNAFSPTAGFDAQGGGQMRFSGARVPDQQQVLAILKVGTSHQLRDEGFVDGRLRGEVEGLEGLGRWEFGRLESSISGTTLAVDQLQLTQLK